MYFDNKNFPAHESKIYGKELKWFPADILKNYDINNNEYSATDISYKFNSHGFRCDEFNEYNNLRIVFLGCSVTEGIGVRQEETWAFQLLKMIRKKINCNIPYWNLSLGGCGLDSILRAYYQFCDALQPHVLIAYLPEYRKEIFDRKTNKFKAYTINDINSIPKEFFEENYMKYETSKNFLFLKLLTEKYNTKFFWNSWGDLSFYNKKPTFSSHIKFDKNARDKIHPGKDAHFAFAQNVWQEINSYVEI